MTKAYEAEIKGLGIVHRVAKPFDEALKTIKGAGASLISARDLAYARIQEGRDSSLCNFGSYIKEGVISVPNQSLFIRNSPLLNQEFAEQAVQAHKDGKEFYIDDKLTNQYCKQAEADKNKPLEKRRVLSLNKRGKFEIPTNRFNQEELTLWLFQDQAENYGLFLRDKKIKGINEMPVYLSSNDNNKNFANQLWLCGLDCRSVLGGYGRGLGCGDDVRGVLKGSAEGTS
ncbi:MAG: hypothetical protein AABW67_00660, partial [Nanoarchaeota archaeon]